MRLTAPLLSTLLLLLVILLGLLNYSAGYPFPPTGPSSDMAETARHLWRTGSVVRPDFYLLYETLHAEALRTGRTFYQDVFALGANGALLPKHPFLVSLLAVPFYGLAGLPGVWLCNQVALLALLWSLFRLLRSSVGGGIAGSTILIALAGTPIVTLSYSLSHDLFAATFVICGLDIMRTRPLIGGFLLSASLGVRLTNVLYLPLLPLFVARRRASAIDAVAGVLLGTGLLLLLNVVFWGDPLRSPYSRLMYIGPSGLIPDVSSHYLSWRIFVDRWYEKLLSPEFGLLRFAPLVVLFPIGPFVAPRPQRGILGAVALCALANSVVIFSYSYWMATSNGNRYLLPAVMLSALPLGEVIARLRGGRPVAS